RRRRPRCATLCPYTTLFRSGIDKRCCSAGTLCLGDCLQRECRLTGGLRPVDFDDAPARQTADTKRDIQTERSRRDHIDVVDRACIAEAHDRALAELLFDLPERGGERLLAIFFHRCSAP